MNKTPPQYIISQLEQHNSRLNKEAIILAAAKEDNRVFFKGLQAALDSMITFGLKQVPEKLDTSGSGLDWVDFAFVVDKLVARELTGHAARDAVKALMDTATPDQWNKWYRRILIKDLRCGVSEKTVNNVVGKKYSEYAVPVFSCQLAHDSSNHESKVVGRKLIEVKLDGVRVITVVYTDGRVVQFSRNGKELVNFDNIKKQFSSVANTLTEPCVFDGEVVSSSFQALMKQVHRKSNVAADDAVLYLFDMMPLTDFQQGYSKLAQTTRSSMLKSWYQENANVDMPNIQILDQQLIDLDTAEGKKVFKDFNQNAISAGFEGIMIKDPEAPYECKRSHSWLKLKPFIEVSLTVSSVEEGTGRNQGKLGAFVCEGTDDGKFITVNVGSGFSDFDREEFWKNRELLLGKIVEVRADAITQNQDSSYSLRFPRFLCFRGFDNGEKL